MKICTENRKVKFPLPFNSSLHESIFFKVVLIIIIIYFIYLFIYFFFFILNILIPLWVLPPKIMQ
jgi:hypothetical protein